MRTLNTRTKYKIIGSDYSAQEPRLTAHMSKDPEMIKAYQEGKDLYCVIGTGMFNNNYEDNLAFYSPGLEIDIDGVKVLTGDGKAPEFVETIDNSIELLFYKQVETTSGEKYVRDLQLGDQVVSDEGNLTITKLEKNDKLVKIFF
jgi:hypothetical protein